MLSRVGAVKAPRTDNRRRVTGSSGRRREGGESEPQRPNMSRHLFTSAVLLLLFVMMCCGTCGAAAAVESKSGVVQLPKWVDIFLPNKTQVVAKNGSAAGTPRDSFVSPSLVSAGGVIAAFAEGHENVKFDKSAQKDDAQLSTHFYSDVVAGYIDSAWDWATLVDKVNQSSWGAHIVLTAADGQKRLDAMPNPTTIAKGDKVFLLSESSLWHNLSGKTFWDRFDLKLVVGTVTNSTGGEPSERISWEDPKPLSGLNTSAAFYERKFERVFPSGGSGVLMDNGALVFPVIAIEEENDGFSMIIYSTDDGANWMLSNGTSPARCETPRVTEWEGSLLMIVDCENDQSVFESRDMGTTWTEAIGTLPGVWTKSKSKFISDRGFYVEALITATIEGRKVMLYTQRGDFSEKNKAKALHLLVTDNIRLFCVGPVAMEDGMNWLSASSLLYSDGNLHLLRQRENSKCSAFSLSRLTEELSTIKFVLSTWAKKDAFFSKSSAPTAGLVAVLSDAASDGRWIDEYRCVNATVTKAAKVKNGFKFTGPGSGAMWSMSRWGPNKQYSFVNHRFTLVATVTIHQVPKGSTPLLGAGLGDGHGAKIIGLSCGMNKTWETVFDGKKTTSNTTWELGKEHQVALMLQDGNKGSVYVDGVIVGGPAKIPKVGALGHEITHFYFGGDEGDSDSSVTVTNVFLYNRPLSVGELKMVRKSDGKKGKGDGSMRGGISRLLLLLGLGFCASVALY
ncbi:putative trans-sialidase, Group II [Trypanosoma cruzi]|uniref:Putative trans-sialidase, Group II n=1 Tax=Trypanosoma cruzi TaxID=5693 RepID=A0A2V2UJ79_TRYCR|nr:putative trans-sialidase, Group II [Trypanosoma cruzi]